MTEAIVELKGVGKSYKSADGRARSVLEGVDFRLAEGEIVALLGQSGSGKSTLLRILAGLVGVDAGDVSYRGQPLYGPARGVAMVFQSFALFPWLTVQQNVELGLEARGMPRAERERRAEKAIELIGLAGFEGALPRELSGGMRQRVGIARALVVEPEVLLMDEAFSALDVLTGERLREDILELWVSGEMPTKAILVVSHNIEEAVLMADRVLVFASDPGRVRFQLAVRLPRPRDAESPEVRMLVDEVYALMTAGHTRAGRPTAEPARIDLAERLPDADVARMEGLLEMLVDDEFAGRADLPKLGEVTELTDDELLPLVQALSLLEFSRLADGDLHITPLGRQYVDRPYTERQEIFGRQLQARVPLVAHIRHSLDQEPSGELPEEPFLGLLRQSLDEAEAERVMRTAIEWGRHGGVFEYNYTNGLIHLRQDDEEDAADTSLPSG
jgi:NitT/TauT family transport system ATP-binding protein